MLWKAFFIRNDNSHIYLNFNSFHTSQKVPSNWTLIWIELNMLKLVIEGYPRWELDICSRGLLCINFLTLQKCPFRVPLSLLVHSASSVKAINQMVHITTCSWKFYICPISSLSILESIPQSNRTFASRFLWRQINKLTKT
jgi:hypothetical protein